MKIYKYIRLAENEGFIYVLFPISKSRLIELKRFYAWRNYSGHLS